MKVVLFAGGYGLPSAGGPADLPKPMHPVGPRPLIWHLMRYCAHFGHTDFVVCLGAGAHHVKDYFLRYSETESNDFRWRGGRVETLGSDIGDWTITFVHTGMASPIGERLRRVRSLVADEEVFLALHTDLLTDAPLDAVVEQLRAAPRMVGTVLVVPPRSAFHCVNLADDDADGTISSISTVQEMRLWQHGGVFALRPEILDHIPENGDLLDDAVTPLAAAGRMLAYRHDGFWLAADTVKERTALEAAYQSGTRPWMPWEGTRDGYAERSPLQSAISGLRP